jgi:hypothetical protein
VSRQHSMNYRIDLTERRPSNARNRAPRSTNATEPYGLHPTRQRHQCLSKHLIDPGRITFGIEFLPYSVL